MIVDHHRLAKLAAKRDNARGLAYISRQTADEYARKGITNMAEHHRIKAERWAEAADDLDEQIAYEGRQGS